MYMIIINKPKVNIGVVWRVVVAALVGFTLILAEGTMVALVVSKETQVAWQSMVFASTLAAMFAHPLLLVNEQSVVPLGAFKVGSSGKHFTSVAFVRE